MTRAAVPASIAKEVTATRAEVPASAAETMTKKQWIVVSAAEGS